jgi:alkylhydroperoxidase family enzyme
MSRLPPLPVEALPVPLQDALARGRQNRMLSSTLPPRIWAHRPAVATAWLAALEEIHVRGCLDERLRELVRLRIAAITTCQPCMLARKTERVTEEDVACLSSEDSRFTLAERSALRFAELFAGDYLSIDDATYQDLALHFSVEQIVELNLYCALMLAGGRMTYVQRAYEPATGPTASEQ